MYNFKETYILDFSKVEHYLDIHNVIKKELDFPDYYGCNWDAFWDCLTDMLGRPIHIEILGLEVIEQKFGDAADKLVDILKEFKHCDDNEYTNEIRIEIVSGEKRVSIT
jgi:RNAse (barnase) inhibitor barstar